MTKCPLQRSPAACYIAAGCTLLVLVQYFWSPAGSADGVALTNRALAIGAIWAAAILVDRWIGAFREHRQLHDRLDRATEENLKLVLGISRSNDVIFMTARDGTITFANAAFTAAFGWTEQEVIGKKPSILKSGQLSDAFYKQFWQQLLSGTVFAGEIINRTKDGRLVTMDVSVNPIIAADGSIVGFLAIQRDITARKQAEEKLRQYATIVESSSDMMALLDKNHTYFAVNTSYATMFGKSLDDMVGGKPSDVFGETFFQQTIRPHAERCLAGAVVDFEGWFEFPAAGRRYMEMSYIPYRGEDGLVAGFVVNGRDKTENRKLQEQREELLTKHEELTDQLRTLSKRLLTTQEEERQHIARELHDSFGQILTALLTHLERIKRAHVREDVLEASERIHDAARQAFESIHEMSNFLRPPELDDLGLREAIGAHVSEFEKNTGVNVELSVYFREDSIPIDVRLHIFRIIQEALRNILRHADARNVTIAMSNSSDEFHLVVEDDGTGFAFDQVDFHKHHGILGMRERARLLGGTLAFTHPAQSGTRVELRLPTMPHSDVNLIVN